MQANLVSSDVYPVVGQKRSFDGFNRILMAGDREKNGPLFIEREGVGKRVKPVGLYGN
jgi:hypothetical protein